MSGGARTRPRVVSAAPRIEARARAARSEARRRRLRRVAYAAGAAVPVAVLVWVVLFSPLLSLQRVQVTGTARLTADAVEAAVGVPAGTPLARVDLAGVVRRVEALPAVEHVVVRRAWPRTLRVQVFERQAVAVAQVPGRGWVLVDRTGATFAAVSSPPSGAAVLRLARVAAGDPLTAAALAVLAELPPQLRVQVAAVGATSPDAVTLGLRDGREVVWGGAGGATVKAAAVAALLRLPGRVIDVSAPGVAIRR